VKISGKLRQREREGAQTYIQTLVSSQGERPWREEMCKDSHEDLRRKKQYNFEIKDKMGLGRGLARFTGASAALGAQSVDRLLGLPRCIKQAGIVVNQYIYIYRNLRTQQMSVLVLQEQLTIIALRQYYKILYISITLMLHFIFCILYFMAR
jgi:hypothetical protein